MYNPRIWYDGDIVTSGGLNNIEQGIAQNAHDIEDLGERVTNIESTDEIDQLKSDLFKYNSMNIMDTSYADSRTNHGVTFTWSVDKTQCSVSGTATDIATAKIYDKNNMLPYAMEAGKTYIVVFNSNYVTFRLYWYNSSGSNISNIGFSHNGIFTIPSDAVGAYIRLEVGTGLTVNETVDAPVVLNTYSNAMINDFVRGQISDLKNDLQQDVYNFINYPSEQVTDEGITFTPKADEIVISGTATGGDAWFRLYNKAEFSFGIENGKQYYIAVNQDDSEEYGLYLNIYYYDSSGSHLIASMNNGYFMFPYDAIGYALTLVVPQGVTLNNITVRPIMCELGNIKKILDNATKDIKRNLYTNLRYQTVTSNGITFTTNGNSIVLNGTSGNDYPIFVLCDSYYSLLYGLTAGKSYWFDVGLKDKTKVNFIYIALSFYLSDGTRTTEVGIKGPTKITVPINAVGFYMILRTQRKGLVIADNIIVSPGIYIVNPMAESRILEQAISASENVISINGNYASYKDFNLYGVFLNRVTGNEELNPVWRSGYIPIPFAGKYQIFQNYGMFGNTYLNVPLYDKNKRFIKSITGVDSAFQNIIEVTISESDLYDDMVYYIGLTYEPSASPDGIPMFMHNMDYPSDQRFIEPKYSVYKPYQPPMISIIDDDGTSGFLTKLLPIIESKNIPIASAVITSFADDEQNGYMTWDEIVDANNRGAEFVSHSDTHLFSPTSIGDAQMNYMRSFNKLRAHGVINDRNILVYAGASAAQRNALVGARQIADGAIISSGNSMNYRGYIDPWMIRRYRIDADYQYNLDSMKELIDDCKSNGGWMIWMIHCSASEWDEYNADTSFPQAIDYAIQKGVQIATINHAFKTYVD